MYGSLVGKTNIMTFFVLYTGYGRLSYITWLYQWITHSLCWVIDNYIGHVCTLYPYWCSCVKKLKVCFILLGVLSHLV